MNLLRREKVQDAAVWQENKILSEEQTNQVSRSNFSRHKRKLVYVEPLETQQDKAD